MERVAIRLQLFSNTTDRALELLFDESIYTLCSLILLQPALSLVLGLLLVPLLLLCQRPRLIQQLLFMTWTTITTSYTLNTIIVLVQQKQFRNLMM